MNVLRALKKPQITLEFGPSDAIALARVVGVRLSKRSPQRVWMKTLSDGKAGDLYANEVPYDPKLAAWNGETIATGGRLAWSVLHDIAHYMVAPDERRFEPDYGLGPDPEDTYCKIPRLVTNAHAEGEDRRASMLEFLLCRHMGGDWHFDFHNRGWSDSWPDVENAVGWLMDVGLIQGNLIPCWPDRPRVFPMASVRRAVRQIQREVGFHA